jgi:hypothetical protein
MDTMLLVVTVASLVVAAASAMVAWQVTRAERQRRAARVAALVSAAGLRIAAPVPEAPVPSGLHEFMSVDDTPMPAPAIFAPPSAASGSAERQQWLMGAAGVFAAVVITFAGIGFVGSRAAGAVVGPTRIPLELVALSHNRGDSGLAVAGLVRNPAAAAGVPQLEAEVRVFDAAGILIGSQSTLVEASPLAAGQEATFSVALGELSTAARYRVSFHAAGTILPHVDRRTHQPAAVTAEAR